MIATRRDFEALVFKDRGEPAVLHGWRRGVVGEKLLAAVDRGLSPQGTCPLLAGDTLWGGDIPLAGECPLPRDVPVQPPAARRNSA